MYFDVENTQVLLISVMIAARCVTGPPSHKEMQQLTRNLCDMSQSSLSHYTHSHTHTLTHLSLSNLTHVQTGALFSDFISFLSPAGFYYVQAMLAKTCITNYS